MGMGGVFGGLTGKCGPRMVLVTHIVPVTVQVSPSSNTYLFTDP